MITIRWPLGTDLEGSGDLVREKSREVARTGLIINPKNVVGLKTGAIVSFWENAKVRVSSPVLSSFLITSS